MNLPTESQWSRYSALRARLTALPTPEREAALQALRATGNEDPQVLSLLAVHCALPPDPTRDRSGERLGNCTLEERLGAGGMGVVYRAQQHLGPVTRPVAVKLIHPALLLLAREEALARFLAELQTLVTLQHEHIARIYDGGIYEDPHTHEQLPYIAMELVHGGLPITTYARDYALSWQERLAVFVRVCHAVRYAHEHRVVHRDLKPANILVDHDGRPVVIDFGLAHACDALLPGAHIAASGTPAYMSPEQVSDTLGGVSDKSDVYALGLILYELLTEQAPYALPRNGSVEEWFQIIMEATPPPLRQYNAAYGGELEAIVAAALAKQPAHRIPVAVLRSRLERYLQTLALERDRSLHGTRQVQRDIQTVPSRGDHCITPVDVRPWVESGGSSATAPETRRLTAHYDLDQAGTGSPHPSVQPAPQSVLPPTPGTANAPGATKPDRSAPERRQLTVMFCDLVGSTALSGQLDPEDLREVLRAYLETCVEVIARFGGNIEKFLGDGALVCFGYPQAHDDDPQRAVRAGLMIIESIARLNTRLAQRWGVQLEVRLGIHTGLVVAGDLGMRETREPQEAIVGEAPNVAARLQELAAPNTVVISAATARLVGGYFNLDALGPQVLKGVAMPVPVYRVVGETAAQTRFDVAAARGLTPFVGREHEVALLLERWAAAKDSRGQVILLSGEAGIGKSRLVQVFREHLTSETYTLIAYHCSPYYQQSAFYPVVEHLQWLLQFRKDDTPEEKLHKLEAALGPYDFALEEVVPLLAALLSLPLPERYPPLSLTPEQQKQKTLETLLTWLLKEAERQPVCMIMEDLHWGDASTLEWLRLLIDQVPTACMLLLLLCRPEFHPPWAPRAHLTPIALQTLGRAHVEAMATHVAGGKTLPSGLITQIAEKTDGVPLFVEEMIKAIVESNVLRDVGDHYALTGPVEAVRIPMTLHDALMARLDRSPSAKSLAQVGAVIGRQFSYDLVKALTAYDESRLRQELGQLVDAELLYQRGLPPRATYMFKHALVQDVAYESLLRRQRQTLHGTIADAIEALEGVRVAAQAGILAYHYARSLHQDKAITYALLAGDEAVRLHARTEATTHYVQALTLVRGLPVTPEAQRMQIDAILRLATVSSSREDLARDQANLEQAQTLAETLQDQPRLAQVLYWQGRLAYVRGDLQTAIIYAEQSLAIADRLEDETLSAPPVNLLGRSYTMWWDVTRGSQLLVRSTAQMHQIGSRVEEATAAGFAAMAFGALGEFAQALAYGDRGIALARESTNPFAEAAAVFYRGVAYTHQGAWTQALADFDAARRVAKGVEDHFRVYVVNLYAGWASTRAGDPAAGRVLLEQAFTIAEQIGTVFHVALGKAWLAACALALGALDTVPALCQEALRVAGETSDRFAQAVAHCALAEALALGTAPDRQQAEQAMGKAIQRWKEIAFNPELARTYVSYARLLQGWGQDGQAKVYLTEAIAMFQKMGMDWDLTQVVVLS